MKKKRIFVIVGIALIAILVIVIPIITINVQKYLKEKRQQEAELAIGFNENIEFEVLTTKKISEIVNEQDIKIIDDKDFYASKIGNQKLKFKYLYNGEEFTKELTIKVVDTTEPTIFASSSYTVNKGSKRDFASYILSGDNYDDNPTREIRGTYDLNTIGTYNVTYYIRDNSGNEAEKDFKIKVINPPKSSSSSTTTTTNKILFSDVVAEHKNEKTEIGIDVSKWQGNIDFAKVKQAGCEFVMIRLGHQNGLDGELIKDPYYDQNIKGAVENGLKVGVYLYTYAKTEKEAISQADWVLKNIGNYEIPLGISYDWESWTNFNKTNLSYHHFNQVADSFMDRVSKKGYKGVLYSSKYYLENIWDETDHDVWLAHYTKKTTYTGKYRMWQRTSSGQIDGIKGAVDIDILYRD